VSDTLSRHEVEEKKKSWRKKKKKKKKKTYGANRAAASATMHAAAASIRSAADSRRAARMSMISQSAATDTALGSASAALCVSPAIFCLGSVSVRKNKKKKNISTITMQRAGWHGRHLGEPVACNGNSFTNNQIIYPIYPPPTEWTPARDRAVQGACRHRCSRRQ
jgi:hypothetical protein